MGVAFGVAVLVVAAVAVALAIRFRRRPAIAAGDVPREIPKVDAARVPDEVSAPPEPFIAPPEPAITWTAQLTGATLDEAARLRLVEDLALLSGAWAIALLRRAHEEEQDPQLRARIEAALASCS